MALAEVSDWVHHPQLAEEEVLAVWEETIKELAIFMGTAISPTWWEDQEVESQEIL